MTRMVAYRYYAKGKRKEMRGKRREGMEQAKKRVGVRGSLRIGMKKIVLMQQKTGSAPSFPAGFTFLIGCVYHDQAGVRATDLRTAGRDQIALRS